MGSSRFIRRRLLAGLAATASAVGVTGVAALAGPASALASPHPHVLAGSTPGWLGAAHDLGGVAPAQRLDFGVLLNMRDQAGAAATLQAISEPRSPGYGRWLSNKSFTARYAPAPASVGAVQHWLRASGFTVTQTLPSGMYIEASGSAAQVQKVFGTKLRNYTYLGKTVRANATALTLPASTPAAVSTAIAGITGIDQGAALKRPASTEPGPAPGARYGVQPCSAYYGQKIATQPAAYGAHQPRDVCGYVPQQYQSAYGETSLLKRGMTGRGVTVAITDAYASPT